jgi:tetratricopeptide (TPR) repeat protein
VLGPLLNANHLGCLMAMGAVLSLGLVMQRHQAGWLRALWVVISAGCATVALASLSRGAALALAIGGAVTVGAIVMQRYATREGRRRSRARFVVRSLPMAIVAACGFVLVIYSSAGGVAAQLSNTSLQEISQPKSKFMAWRSSIQLIEAAPLAGVGRGGFETAFTRVHPAAAFVSVSHVENEYVQAVIDWGIPGALLLGLAGASLVFAALRRWRDGPLTAGALGALAVVGAQSMVDFGVEMLGVAVPITVVVATLVYVPVRELPRNRVWIARGIRVGLIAALIGAAALLLSDLTTSVLEDHDALVDSETLTLDDIRVAAERHPLDYLDYGLAAQVLARQGDIHAVTTLNHSLVLHPTHPGLHRMAARILHATDHEHQAAIEYADALRGTQAPRMILDEIMGAFSDSEIAADAIPPDFANVDTIVRQLYQLGRPEVAIEWLTHVLELRPKDVHACELLYAISVNTGDLSGAETIGRHCVELAPSHQTRFGLARVLFQREAYVDAIQQLQDVSKWPGRVADIVAGWFMLCDSYEQLSRYDDAELCLHKLDARGLVVPEHHDDIQHRLDQIDKDRKHDTLSGPKATKPWIVWLR